MKKIVYSLLIALLICQIANAQGNKTIDSLKSYISELQKTLEQKTCVVGRLSFTDGSYPVYYHGIEMQSTTIDSMEITIIEGFIYDLKVYAPNHIIYTNHQAPIAVTDRRLSGNATADKLYNINHECIIFQEVINFRPFKGYAPGDTTFTITKKHKNISLIRDVSINSIFEIKLYTDALALVGGEENGLAQTDIRFKQFIHRSNLWNKGTFVFQYFKMGLTSSKFDSKYKFTDSLTYSRAKFLQRSFVNAEMTFNLLNGWFEKKSTQGWYADFGGGVALGRLSKKNDSISETLSMPYFISEVGLNFKKFDNIGVNASLAWINGFMPQNDFSNDEGCLNMMRINAEFYYNPFNNKSGRIFGKLGYTLSGRENEQKHNFFQLQVGYTVQLSKLMEKK